MKIAVIVVRTLVGLLFLFASATYFLNLVPQPELTGNIKTFMEGLSASGYLLTVVKILELVCALLLLFGRFVPLALVLLAPIVVNIFFVHLLLDRSGLPVAIPLVLAMIFLGYAYRTSYAPLFEARARY